MTKIAEIYDTHGITHKYEVGDDYKAPIEDGDWLRVDKADGNHAVFARTCVVWSNVYEEDKAIA